MIDFIATKSFENERSEEMKILKLLISSRIFYEQKQYSIALKTIKRAELKAKKYDLFSILHEIYYTKIQYAHLDENTSLENLISDLKTNQKLLQQEENLNLFYANIKDKLTHNTNDIAGIINVSLDKFDITATNDLTFRSLYKILEIINEVAHVTRDFYSVLSFVQRTYEQIKSKEQITDKHLFYHIQVLYYVANSYFRNKDFHESQKYLSQMEEQMYKQRKKYYKRFSLQYTLLKALNYNYSGNATDAILIIEQLNLNKFKDQMNYVLDLQLLLIVFYFQQSRFTEALRLFKELHHSDTWYTEKAGVIWVIKKNLTEILLHIELDHIELVESRTKSFRKKHRIYLRNNNESRVLEFLSLTMNYYLNSMTNTKEEFLHKIQHSLINNNPDQEDIFTMSFYAWLKAKVLNADIYQTTLQVINSSNNS